MAIPFNLPSDECSLEQYRSIHQLLVDLINLLRALLNSEIPPPPSPSPNSPLPAYGTYFGFPTPPSSVPSSPSPFSPGAASTTAFVLPDVVASAMPAAGWNTQPQMMVNSIPVTEPESALIPEPITRRGSTSSLSNKLRKRKRARLSKKKKIDCVDSHCNLAAGWKCCAGTTQCERHQKIPKTTGTVCSCACPATELAGVHQQHHSCNTDVPSPDAEYYIHQSMLRRTMPHNDCKSPSWTYIGEELRRMTDGFQNTSARRDEKMTGEDINEAKGNGLISQCGRTVFAAALLVLGWKLLKQN